MKTLEHYGSEPPDGETDWTYKGEGKWIKQKDDPTPRVAVVGGGPGGLFAAYILNQRMPSAKVTMFEASQYCGGKIYTSEFSDGTPFEAGVAELYEYKGRDSKDPLRSLIEDDLGLETIDISGGGVVLRDKMLKDLDDVEKEHGKDTRDRIEAFHKKMIELMSLEKYAERWQPDNEHPWADKTFKQCIEEEITSDGKVDEVAREYIEAAVASDLATESHTCNGLNGIKNVLMDNDDYIQLYHIVGGISRLPDRLEEKVEADIHTSTRVTSITKDGGNYQVSSLKIGERTLKEDVQTFDAVIVALPNHWLRLVKWGEGLREAIHETCAHYDLPAHYLRVSILFDNKWWTHLDAPGEFWMMDMLNGCCCYDESTRWGRTDNNSHILSWLLAGGDALLMCSGNQDDEEVIEYVLQSLPPIMRQDAENHFLEGRVDRYVGSINAQPGGWPAEELRGEHIPDKEGHPGVFLVGDYFFDSTLNAALMSANVAVELLLEYFGVESEETTEAIKELETKDIGV